MSSRPLAPKRARTDEDRETIVPDDKVSAILTLYFYPESVDALYEEIKDHTPPAWGPEVRDWGARELGLRDPNGYFLTFTEDVAL